MRLHLLHLGLEWNEQVPLGRLVGFLTPLFSSAVHQRRNLFGQQLNVLALWTEATHTQFLLEVVVQGRLGRQRKVAHNTWRFEGLASLKTLLVVLGDLYVLERFKAVQDAARCHRPLRKVSLWSELCGFSLLSRE